MQGMVAGVFALWYSLPMRPLKSLTLETVIGKLSGAFPGIPGQATCESSSEPALFSLEQSADTLSLIFLDEHPASALRLVSVSLV